MTMVHPEASSRIELSRSALGRNVRFLSSQLGDGVTFCSVIKGNAYGHGIETFVPLAEEVGIRCFAVFGADEAARAVATSEGQSHVVVMGHIADEALEWAIEAGVSFYVFDVDRLEAARAASERVGKAARIHLELETGLYRTGFEGAALERAIAVIRGAPERFVLEGVCTHLAGAEDVSNYLRIRQQIERFRSARASLEADGLVPRWWHMACSAASLTYPDSILDMARIGIAQYGFWPSKQTEMEYVLRHSETSGSRHFNPLRRVLRWSSRIMSVKEVPPGKFVGYGTAYLTSRTQRIATVPVGYCHGFSRGLGNRGRVLVRGRRAQVVGTINMNMLMVDVTSVPGARRGDEVVIIGRQGKQHITVGSFSDWSSVLTYEVLVRIPDEIPRVVVP